MTSNLNLFAQLFYAIFNPENSYGVTNIKYNHKNY